MPCVKSENNQESGRIILRRDRNKKADRSEVILIQIIFI